MILNNPTNPTNGFLQQVQIAYKGNSNWPSSTEAKGLMYIAIANRLLDEWAIDPNVLWFSLWQQITLTPTIASTTSQTFQLPNTAFYLSDSVNVLLPPPYTAGTFDTFQVVHPNRRNDFNNSIGLTGGNAGNKAVYVTGSSAGRASNLVVNFVEPFADYQVGGTVSLGVYAMPNQLINDTDIIPVDDPQWLVWMTASELARNDPSKQDQVPNLIGMANQSYGKMVTGNQGNSFEQPNSPFVYNMPNPGMRAPIYGSA